MRRVWSAVTYCSKYHLSSISSEYSDRWNYLLHGQCALGQVIADRPSWRLNPAAAYEPTGHHWAIVAEPPESSCRSTFQ